MTVLNVRSSVALPSNVRSSIKLYLYGFQIITYIIGYDEINIIYSIII